MPKTDLQLFEAVDRHLLRKIAIGDSRQTQFAEIEFDRDFPETGEAYETLGRRDGPASLIGEFRPVLAPPEKCVCIEQKGQV
jgi:hypothetical protein